MASFWVPDWSWGLPLLVLTVVAHVSAIVLTAKMLGTSGLGTRARRRASSCSLRSRRSPRRCISGSKRRPGRLSISGSAPCPTGETRCSIRSGRSPATVTPRLSRGPLAAARGDRGGQRPHPVRPDDRVSLRRHSRGLAAQAGLMEDAIRRTATSVTCSTRWVETDAFAVRLAARGKSGNVPLIL